MSDAEVKVIVNPHTGNTVSALKEVEHAIKSLVSPLIDVKKSLTEIAELTGIAFAVEKISEFVEKMADVGERATNMGAALNMSAEEFNNLSGALSLVGVNADKLVQSYRAMQNAAEAAISSPASRQAFAFAQVGLDPEKFIETLRTKPGEAIDALAEKVKELGSLGGPAGPFGLILGRGAAEFFKALERGKEGIEELKKEWIATGAPSQSVLTEMDKLKEKVNLAKGAFENLGVAIVDQVVGPLGTALDIATKLVSAVTKAVGGLPGKYPGSGRDEIFPKPGEPGGGPASGVNPDVGRSYEAARSALGEHPNLSVKDQIRLWLYANGYSDDAVAAILGNAEQESNFDPMAGGQIGAEHFGLFQLDRERQKDLGSRTDVPSQMEAMDKQLSERDAAFRTATGNVVELTKRFQGPSFEGAAGQDTEKRQQYAEKAKSEGPAGEGTAPPDKFIEYEKDKQAYDKRIKDIKDSEKEAVASLEKQKEAAHGNEKEQLQIDASIRNAKRKSIADENAANEEMAAKWPKFADKYRQDKASDLKADTEYLKAKNKLTDEDLAIELRADQAKLKRDQDAEASELKTAAAQAKIHNETADQLAANETAIVNRHREAQEQILAQEATTAQGRIKLEQQIQEQRLALEQKTDEKLREISLKADEQRAADAKKINDTIGAGLATAVTAALTGKQTFGAALGQQLESLLGDAIKHGFEKAFEASPIGKALDDLFSKALSSAFSGLAKVAGNALTSTATSAAGNAAGSVAGNAAGSAVADVAGSTPVVAAITALGTELTAALVTLGVTITTAMSVNDAVIDAYLSAILLKPSFGGTTFARGGIVSAAGGWALPSFSGGTPAVLHQNEMVLPSDISQGLQGMIRGGGGGGGGGHTFNLNVSAMDGASVMRAGPALVASINSAMRNGSQLRAA